MKRSKGIVFGLGVLAVVSIACGAAPTLAQTSLNQAALNSEWARSEELTALNASRAARLDGQTGFEVAPDRDFGPAVDFAADYTPSERGQSFAATSRRDLWREGEGFSDRVRLTSRGTLRRADGSPVPPTPQDAAQFDVDGYDVSFTRGFTAARGFTASGLEISLTPHAGLGVGDRGTSAEAGATLRIGSDLERMVPEGSAAFGQRARWYLYAAGSGRAVGYNFARDRDGSFNRSGVSHDSGSFLGDASIGVAFRKGDVQTSFGLVYREVEAKGMPGGGKDFDDDVDEGLVAFQLSIKPEW